jgi:membrane protein YdbS with pleckstrin-like domain
MLPEVSPSMMPPDFSAIFQLERPDRRLLTYYVLSSLLAGPFFPILLLPAYFRYHTLRYRFDAEGVSMRWGLLFRREIILNYARIQDIHLSSNLLERWLGLARIQIQTASGSAAAEMTLEGFTEFESIRDFLYSKMRGLHSHPANRHPPTPETAPGSGSVVLSPELVRDLVQALQDTTRELRQLRQAPPPTAPPSTITQA